MPSRLLHSTIGRAIAGAAVLLLTVAQATAQGYVEFRPTAAAGSPAAAAVSVRLLPTVADATAAVSAYGYVSAEQAQYLYVGLAITNNGDQPLALVPGSCRWTDDLGRRASGGSLFSGQTPLASATVAAGGRDDLQLGFAVPGGALLAEIRSITVDVALTYAGRPYMVQVQFSKSAPGQVPPPPAQPSPLVEAMPARRPSRRSPCNGSRRPRSHRSRRLRPPPRIQTCRGGSTRTPTIPTSWGRTTPAATASACGTTHSTAAGGTPARGRWAGTDGRSSSAPATTSSSAIIGIMATVTATARRGTTRATSAPPRPRPGHP